MSRFLKPFAFLVAAVSLALPAAAQQLETPIPAKRLIVERDMDYFGADLRSLFDTTYEACRIACVTDPDCGAFTFNARSNSCFPKREMTRREPYEGAMSAIVLKTAPATMEQARRRAADLDFLRPADFKAALKEAEAMPDRHLAGGWTLEAVESGAIDSRDGGDPTVTMRWTGAAIVLADKADHWLDYARDALTVGASKDKNARNIAARALPASINAYLRADTPEQQAESLLTLSEALESAKRGRDMLPALRQAAQLSSKPWITAALDTAIGKYGFRIVDHEVNSDPSTPNLCVSFSEPLAKGVDFEPYVRLPAVSLSVDASDRQLCIEGVEHGNRYRVTFRAGLPSASGDGMLKDVPLDIYVRDRAPSVRFPGRSYVLPRTADAALPIVTVNLSEIDLALRRVSDRNLMQMIQENMFGHPLSTWEDRRLTNSLAEEVWIGTGEVETQLNSDVTTLLPMGEAIAGLPPGLYALKASIRGADPYEVMPATQWFVISDIGLASMSGADGLHVFARSLATAGATEGLKVSLVSRSNRVLGTAVTDADGYARFDAGLTLGRGGATPALLMAQMGEDDLGFLPLTDPEFDLSDRGVEGRAAAGPIDVFLATDRGAYRAGETVHATVLARDGRSAAIEAVPLTAILSRPDGVEYTRLVSDGGVAGGHVFALPVGASVQRGTWKLDIHVDPETPALATQTLLVEDFLPEQIDFDMALPETDIGLFDSPPLRVSSRYLFGAPGADLPVEGEVSLRAASELDGLPGYRFGRHDDLFDPRMEVLPATRTDASGAAVVPVTFPDITDPARPLKARFTLRLSEGSGRPVERRITRTLTPTAAMIGIRQLFDGVVPEGAEAEFDLLGVGPDAAPVPMRIKWVLNRIETRYQWYSQYGSWEWEPITRRSRVTSGETTLGNAPLRVSVPVGWGQYELVAERVDGAHAASSVSFQAGWYAPADVTATPDILELSLDKPAYLPGETARLRLVPRHAGKALVTVVSNRLITMKALDLPAGESVLDLPVTDAWGAGAYVTATLVRPLNDSQQRGPTRSLGLAHAAVDPGPAKLVARFETIATAKPRAPLDVTLRVDGLDEGTQAWATIAAVDQGILNLTGYQPPNPSGHYFGQRKLGMGLRDIYGRLIDGRNGMRGRIRSGGDALAEMRMQTPPPTEDLVAFFSGPVKVGTDGLAHAQFDLPAFNGQVKLMAVVWTDDAVGEASTDVLVRDPVVLTTALPRFLAPGDSSRMLLELVHAEGPTGEATLEVLANGLEVDTSGLPNAIKLAQGEKVSLVLPVRAAEPGMATLDIALSTPGGEALSKSLTLPVQVNDPAVSSTSRFTLAAGDSFTLSRDVFSGLQPGTGSATLALGPLGRFDAPGLLSALDRYPYGCTEQVTSQALPLLYFEQVAQAMGLNERQTMDDRIASAVDKVLSRQSSSGGFGLWRPGDGDFWLDSYVSDFLSRARTQGHAVPELAFTQALDNLRNKINYAADFSDGGEDLAYALLVLAREGAAPIGDLRYYADVKGQDFATPLATAQIGAALALYGDQKRADAMFSRAAAQLMPRLGDEPDQVWRTDYGTNLRDSAGVLALAADAGSVAVDRAVLTNRVAGVTRVRSTQESAWTLLAAHALIDASDGSGFLIDGQPASGPMVQVLADDTSAGPMVITNTSARNTDLTLTTLGVPEQPEGRRSYGYAIDREYFTMDGTPADPGRVEQGTRLVSVLTVTPFDRIEARLMVNDPLPAGLEIDNPTLVRSGDIRQFDWLKTADTESAEFRADRFLAAVDWRSDKPFRLAYIVRAVSPGSYHHPAASVEDMYRPQFRASTEPGRVVVTP